MTEPIRPSEVTKWSRCPQLWYYEEVLGLQRIGGRPPIEQFLGTSIHKGLETYWRRRQGTSTLDPGASMVETLSALWPIAGEYSIDGAVDLVTKVLKKAMTVCDSIDAEVVAVEEPLGEDGHTIPDLITREQGGLVITDNKYHHEVRRENLHYRLEGLEQTHQFQHYIWAVGEKYEEPVTKFRKLALVGLPSVIVQEASFLPDPAATKEWLRSTKIKWHTMKKQRAMGDIHGGLVYRLESGCTPFGQKWPCPMFDACWTCHGDREKMVQFYTGKETL